MKWAIINLMKSPFPGMDPYLEAHWSDVHGSLIQSAKAALQPQLGEQLVARSEERLVVEDPLGSTRPIGPDVRVVEVPGASGKTVTTSGAAVVEPILFTLEAEPVRQRYIEIIDASLGGRVITVIEFLSPSNKEAGDSREQYRRKQQECRDARVNLVEIDLIRQGTRELLAQHWAKTSHHKSTYAVSIWRALSPAKCGLVPVRLQDRLPAIPIPLRANDADAALDLQPLIEQAYLVSRYDLTTDYRKPCEPPLQGEEASWADELLRASGKRS